MPYLCGKRKSELLSSISNKEVSQVKKFNKVSQITTHKSNKDQKTMSVTTEKWKGSMKQNQPRELESYIKLKQKQKLTL